MENQANDGKKLLIEVDGISYARIPVKTHVITDADKLEDVLVKYVKPVLRDGDIVFMSEKAVACTQKRAIRMSEIHPRPLAVLLSKFVYKTPYGIGLGIPETMEMALRECGTIRILFAAGISIIGKLLGKRGWFYNIAGDKARAIDGPCDYTLPPYNEYVVLGPLDPEKAAKEASEKSGVPRFSIVDLNDLGGNILGVSSADMDQSLMLRILKDNPLGQASEQTPIGIIRKSDGNAEPEETSASGWLEANRENMLNDLRRIVSIKSVSDEESDVKPFGQGCRDVLDEMLKICGEHGIECQNHEYYCGSAFMKGETDKEVGIWTHLDVVPESGEWKYPPFEGVVEDGFMIGRGVQDNKSAAIAGIYLMLYFRENKIPLKKGLRVFFGCNEECGMNDQTYYKEHCKIPDYSIIIDSVFPVCYGEKGIFSADLTSPALSGDILGLTAGLVSNMVADKAVVTLKKTDALLEKLNGVENISVNGDSVEITATGRASHAAIPEGSLNAIDVLAKMLIEKDLVSESDKNTFQFISNICGDYTGAGLGIAASHDEFGSLTCIGGKLSLADGKAVLNINIRYPYSENDGIILGVIKARCVEYGFTVTGHTNSAPSLVPRDSEFVKALGAAFSEVTGEEIPPFIMGGGTYARNLPNAVAFGASFHGENKKPAGLPDGHGGIHEPDEALCIDDFMRAMEIYVNAITRVDAIEE